MTASLGVHYPQQIGPPTILEDGELEYARDVGLVYGRFLLIYYFFVFGSGVGEG